MTVSLKKGDRVSLEKRGGGGLTSVTMGLGWSPAKAKGLFASFKQADSIDLDASAIAFAGGSATDVVWFRQLKGANGAIQHSGDNLTGEGDGDDESVRIDLDKLPGNVDGIVLTVSSFRGQTFNEVEDAFCRVVDNTTGAEIARFQLAEKGAHTGVIMAVLAKAGGAWSMKAVGTPANGRTVEAMIPAALDALK
jgi:tellurium resistance protein TerZ